MEPISLIFSALLAGVVTGAGQSAANAVQDAYVGLRDALLIPAALAVLVAAAAGVMRPRHDHGDGAAPTPPRDREQTAAR